MRDLPRLWLFAVVTLGMSLWLAVSWQPVQAQSSLPSGFTETPIAESLSGPTAMAFAPDGRLFMLEQTGRVRIFQNDQLLATPFVQVTTTTSGERGLLGIAFDPAFQSNNYVYLYYTVPGSPARNRVSRFTANGNVAVGGSEQVIFEIDPLSGDDFHNGGALHFGGDGRLYIAVGDNRFSQNAQSFTTQKGKILRINKDGTIPTNNPFYGSTTGNNRAIWALGLRNPFNFAVQPGTGLMLINDVGEGSWEEINLGQAGANYGWPATEGPHNNPAYAQPVYAYNHSGGACSITGGVFYNPSTATFPAQYRGDYFFGDYCARWIRHYDHTTGNTQTFATNIRLGLVDIKIAPNGALYYLARGNAFGTGSLHRITYGSGTSEPPVITQHPQNASVPLGESATFTCSASGSPTLRYRWQRNGVNISGATNPTYTLQTTREVDDGVRFRCVVRNSAGSATSNEALLTVVFNRRPVAEITAPANGSFYSGGDVINYSGTATDLEDGSLPASAFTWEVVFHHDDHTHPFIAPISGQTSGSFTINPLGHTDANVWFRIYLTVEDSEGLEHRIYHDIFPRLVTLNLRTVPTGLQINLDGQPRTTPLNQPNVVGLSRNLEAPLVQVKNGRIWLFDSWSDGGPANRNITIPTSNTTYTARYVEAAVEANYFQTATPTLTWNRISWATGYELQVSLSSSFGDVHYMNNTLSASTLSHTLPAQAAGKYYWRVRARQADNTWGAWSVVESFIVSGG